MEPFSLAFSTKSTTAAAMNIFSIKRSCTTVRGYMKSFLSFSMAA